MFRLAHLSDPHLPPPSEAGAQSALISKRTLSRIAWRSKKRQHDPAVLAAIAADIAVQAPDHLAITGDLTNFSTPAEYAAARAWLATLGEARNVTLSPGNHDALVAEGQAERFATLRPWFGDEGGAEFPHVRRRGAVALVNLCSALPTPPLFAGGRLGAAQLARLGDQLSQLRREGLFRVVMLHHPPVDGVVSRRKALADAAGLRAILAQHGAELVLHGHGHEAVFTSIGAIPVLGAPSASAVPGGKHPPARWHAIEIDTETGAALVIARGLAPVSGEIGEIGRYVLTKPTAEAAAAGSSDRSRRGGPGTARP